MSRGLGRWQQMIADLLAAEQGEERGFVLSWRVADHLGRDLTEGEYSAVMRAARSLSRSGQCRTCYVWARDGGRRGFLVWVCQTGAPKRAWAGTEYCSRRGITGRADDW